MATPFRELEKRMTPEQLRRSDKKYQQLKREEMRLRDLRIARKKTQAEMAASLNVGQGAISKMENRTDLYLSTLREYVESLGGTLVITAKFPDSEILLNGISDLRSQEEIFDVDAKPPQPTIPRTTTKATKSPTKQLILKKGSPKQIVDLTKGRSKGKTSKKQGHS
jgi:transcriptional regulator with XRE-family HTH domain